MSRGFLLPLLNAAGTTEDPDLQELWAQLLASAVSDEEFQQVAYIKILEQLSPAEARILNVVYGPDFEPTNFHITAVYSASQLTIAERRLSAFGTPSEESDLFGGCKKDLFDFGPHLDVLGLVKWKTNPQFVEHEDSDRAEFSYDLYIAPFGIRFAMAALWKRD